MINTEIFRAEVVKLINNLYDTQKGNIEAAAQLIAETIKNDGVVHIYGSGHSVGMGIDVTSRPGCLVPIHIMEMTDFVYKGGVSVEEYNDPVNVFERRPGMAGKIYELYDIRPQDAFIIISNSGINGIVIDLADLARKNGNKVIIITSMQHTLAEESRHPSGKKLYQFGNVVVDNCGPHGDALLETPGIGKVTAVSSICNNVIAQTTVLEVIKILTEEGCKELPVLNGDPEHDQKIRDRYQGRI
ncbi:MAG: sugar isomerase domain-containing protein [Erysipelotrichaceae bacterium]|nr:sugar isomerase domain-containing protein [Erysipelotrichaceae bacterium]